MTLNLADIRQDYCQRGLDISDCAPEPAQQLERWLQEAVAAGVDEPTAMNLATVAADGRPSARIVLLKGLVDGQLHFFTNYLSRKGQDLARKPGAAVTFFWPQLERQVRIEGHIQPLPADLSDQYFASRPRSSQLGAWASEQSQPISDAALLSQRLQALATRYPDTVPRPPHWGGYALRMDYAEFWQGRPSRLHDRICYYPGENDWVLARLQP